MAFEQTIYTDVITAESVDGRDGFGFQAVSSGITEGDKLQIRQRGQHNSDPNWVLTHGGSETDQPGTASYFAADGRFYLSKGHSTGLTNNGRTGNQLSQSLVAADYGDFSPYNPAQLMGATVWNLVKSPSKELPSIEAPLEIDPSFEWEALVAELQAHPQAKTLLPAYLAFLRSLITDPTTRGVIVHTDLDTVLRWIAIGTAIVPEPIAQQISFKGLLGDPWRVPETIVGISPDLGQVPDAGIAVLNLITGEPAGVAVTSTDNIQAGWLLEGDPDDALEMLAATNRWAPIVGEEIATAVADAIIKDRSGAVVSGNANAVLELILGLAGNQDNELITYESDLADALAALPVNSVPIISKLGQAQNAAARSGAYELAKELQNKAFESVASNPAFASAWAAELQNSVPIPVDNETKEFLDRNADVILAATSDAELPNLYGTFLTLRLGTSAGYQNARARLVNLWLTNPQIGSMPWVQLDGGHVASQVAGQVVARLNAKDQNYLVALIAGHWQPLASFANKTPGLAQWLATGSIARVPRDQKSSAIAHIAQAVARSGGPPPLPNEWMFALGTANPIKDWDIASAWITAFGLGDSLINTLAPALIQAAQTQNVGAIVPGTGQTWRSIASTIGQKAVEARQTGNANPQLAALVENCQRIIQFGQVYTAGLAAINQPTNPALAQIMGNPGYLSIYADEAANLLVNAADRVTAAAVISSNPAFTNLVFNYLVAAAQGPKGLKDVLNLIVGRLAYLVDSAAPQTEAPALPAYQAALNQMVQTDYEGVRRAADQQALAVLGALGLEVAPSGKEKFKGAARSLFSRNERKEQ